MIVVLKAEAFNFDIRSNKEMNMMQKFLSNGILLLFILLTPGLSMLNAQSQNKKPSGTKTQFSVQLDENTIVKDSSGARVPYPDYMKMVASGAYTLDPIKDKNGQVSAYKLRPTKAADAGKRSTAANSGSGNYKKPEPGDILPSFTLTDMNGKEFQSDELKGKILVMNFWFMKCIPCLNEMGDLSKLANSYKNNPNVIFIAPDWEKHDAVESFLESHPFAYHVCPEANTLVDQLGIQVYPANLVVGRDGKIRNSYAGGLVGIEEVLKKDIDAALAAK
jgi:peroxiredoxin